MATSYYPPRRNTHHGWARPPSPVMEESRKYSLPSISNLLDLADAASPMPESFPVSPFSSAPETRRSSSASGHSAVSRMSSIPPTPSLSETYDCQSSPSSSSMSQLSALTNYSLEPISPLDQGPCEVSRVPRAAAERNGSVSSISPLTTLPPPQLILPPTLAPLYPAPAPQLSLSKQSMPVLQRPLPRVFPAPVTPPGANPSAWEYRHFIASATTTTYPPAQDRYVCPTCGKPFSRPSSLKIHLHSHTGEKPFKCPRPGCYKAFSVRSNMKRHERGCHGGIAAKHAESIAQRLA